MPAPSDIDALLDATRAFILSGGAARRAGGINKSLITIPDPAGAGRPIIEHQLARLRPLFADRITVVTDRPDDFAPFGLHTLPDFDEAAPEDRFPLRGFARALDAASSAAVSSAPYSGWAFLLAADMPWPDAGLIRAQARRLVDTSMAVSGLVLLHAGRHQPFQAFYHARLAVSARAALAHEDRSLRAWITSEPTILTLPAAELLPDTAALDRAFTGFNAPP